MSDELTIERNKKAIKSAVREAYSWGIITKTDIVAWVEETLNEWDDDEKKVCPQGFHEDDDDKIQNMCADILNGDVSKDVENVCKECTLNCIVKTEVWGTESKPGEMMK